MAQTGYYDRDRTNPAPAGQMNHAFPNVGNTAEYMASGYPFFCHIDTTVNVAFGADATGTASQTEAPADGDVISVAFPYVTRWVMIKGFKSAANVANAVAFVGVSRTGVGTGSTNGPCQADLAFISGEHLEMKCSKLFIRLKDVSECTTIQIVAGLTNIKALDFVVETSDNTNIGVDKTAVIAGTHNVS
jgi:hypothetical protein